MRSSLSTVCVIMALHVAQSGQKPEDQFSQHEVAGVQTLDNTIEVDPEEGCVPDPKEHLFVVHWTHVPKVGDGYTAAPPAPARGSGRPTQD